MSGDYHDKDEMYRPEGCRRYASTYFFKGTPEISDEVYEHVKEFGMLNVKRQKEPIEHLYLNKEVRRINNLRQILTMGNEFNFIFLENCKIKEYL